MSCLICEGDAEIILSQGDYVERVYQTCGHYRNGVIN